MLNVASILAVVRGREGGMYSQSMPKMCSTIDLLSSRAVPTLLLLALPQVNATN
jgi:hypothetical protein